MDNKQNLIIKTTQSINWTSRRLQQTDKHTVVRQYLKLDRRKDSQISKQINPKSHKRCNSLAVKEFGNTIITKIYKKVYNSIQN